MSIREDCVLRKISNYFGGYLKIKLTGYAPERFLNLCKNKEIEIWELESKGNAYEMCIAVRDFRKLKPVLKKTRTRVVILERVGMPFFFHKYRKRKVFFCSIFLCMTCIYIFSRFIWNIEIIGNSSITDEVFIEYLAQEQVYHGMLRNKVNCKEIGTDIRKYFDDVIWVSVSLEGSNLYIHVKENTDTFQVTNEQEAGCDIVAKTDGIITEMVTRKGTPCVQVGDEVKAGDVLVSGMIEVKNDAGEVVRTESTAADADILAEAIIPYNDDAERSYQIKAYKKRKQTQYYVKIGAYYLGVGFLSKLQTGQEQQVQEYKVAANDYFKLPIRLGNVTVRTYRLVDKEYTDEELKEILSENWDRYCEELKENKIELLEQYLSYQETSSGMKLTGTIKIKQSIGTPMKTIDL